MRAGRLRRRRRLGRSSGERRRRRRAGARAPDRRPHRDEHVRARVHPDPRMTTLSLEVITHDPFDLALEAPRFVLWRRGTDVRMSLDERHVAGVCRALALRGVRACVVAGEVPAATGLVRALGIGLTPARLQPEDLDLVEVRVVPLAEATMRALQRPLRYWPLGARRRPRCRTPPRGAA